MTTMNRTMASEPDQSAAGQLTAWLTTLVRNREYGQLAALRRSRVQTDAHVRAGWYDENNREVFERVAFLFGIYHQGQSMPSYGRGSLGTAARRIGDSAGRGPENPGAQRLFDRVVASRGVPWRHLQHTIARLRSCEQPPPSWAQLTEDLVLWNDRAARIAYYWSVDFHAPEGRSQSRPANQMTTRKDATT